MPLGPKTPSMPCQSSTLPATVTSISSTRLKNANLNRVSVRPLWGGQAASAARGCGRSTVMVTTVPLGWFSVTVTLALPPCRAAGARGYWPLPGAAGGSAAKTEAGVGHGHSQLPCTTSAFTRPDCRPRPWAPGRVLDGVLDQALDHHGRELGGEQTVWHLDGGLQALFPYGPWGSPGRAGSRPARARVARAAGVASRMVGMLARKRRDRVSRCIWLARRVGLDQVVDGGQGVKEKCSSHLGLHRPAMRASTTWRWALGLRPFRRWRGRP